MADLKLINDKTGQLETHQKEYTKTFIEFDLNGRPIRIITARHDAVPGEIAVCTLYSYDGVSTRVNFNLEYEIAWQGAWDLLVFPIDAINIGR